MSCGCSNPPKPNVKDEEYVLPIVPYQMPDETTECFMRRIGAQDAAPPPGAQVEKDKIANLTIPVDCAMKVDTTFQMTPNSDPVDWEFTMKDADGNEHPADYFGLVYDNQTGKLSGTYKSEFSGKSISAHMKAKAHQDIPDLNLHTGDVVDEKEYKMVPKTCDKSDLKFIHPNPGAKMTCGFGPRKPPVSGASSYHKGVDFSTHGAANILASADGVVSFAGVQNGYGNIVEISHKDASGKLLAKTKYAHLSKIYVSNGQNVSAGTPIGHEGNTGIGSGPHLHFEILMGGTTAVNPLDYIEGKITVAEGALTSSVDPGAPPGPTTTVNNTNKGMTSAEVDAKSGCPELAPTEPAAAVERLPKPGPVLGGGKCMPPGWVPPTALEVAKQIRDEAQAAGATNRQIRYMLKIAYLESSYNQYASNKNSSALGLFQMLDGTAAQWFAAIGVPCTCENRCNIKYATQAMVKMVAYEEKGYTSSHPGGTYNPNGGIAGANRGPVASNPFTSVYGNISYEEFLYMEHGQGQEGMRKGTPGGAGFLSHFRTHAPSNSVIDSYMAA